MKLMQGSFRVFSNIMVPYRFIVVSHNIFCEIGQIFWTVYGRRGRDWEVAIICGIRIKCFQENVF